MLALKGSVARPKQVGAVNQLHVMRWMVFVRIRKRLTSDASSAKELVIREKG